MFRYLFLLTLLVSACNTPEVTVTEVTPEMRLRASVNVRAQKTWDDGSVHGYRYPGLVVGDDLVLTDILAEPETEKPPQVVYTDSRGEGRKVEAVIIDKDDDLHLMLLRTVEVMNVRSASFMFILPKLGDPIFIMRYGHLWEGIVHTVELRNDGKRFHVWPKRDDDGTPNFRYGDAIFDAQGRVLGIVSWDAFQTSTAINGYENDSSVVFPPEIFWDFIVAHRDK